MNLLEVVSNDKNEIIPINVARVIGLSLDELADLLGVSETSLKDEKIGCNISIQTKPHNAVEVIMLVSTWAGGPYQACSWYRNIPLPALGNVTAETAVKMGLGSYVLVFVESISLGGYA
jgi:hypothetical protein